MRSSLVTMVVAAVLGAAPAAAAPDAAPPSGAKSGVTATALSIGFTMAGFVLVAAGMSDSDGPDINPVLVFGGLGVLAIGPSAGHVYAGEGEHAAGISLLRSISIVAALRGLDSLQTCHNDSACTGDTGGSALAIGGLVAYGGLTLYDMYDAHRAAHRYNARAVTIAPAPLRTPGGRAAPGLVLAGSF